MQLVSMMPSSSSSLSTCAALNFENFKVCQPQRVKILGQYESVGKWHKDEMKLLRNLAPPFMAAVVALSPICNPPGKFDVVFKLKKGIEFLVLTDICDGTVSVAQTVDAQKGATLFRRACIGCHDGGGNIIQPGATLFLKDLQRNGVDTEEEIYRVTYYGKGRMPGFGENCTPRGQCTFGPRLREDEIKLLAEFVKSQADQGWPNKETAAD